MFGHGPDVDELFSLNVGAVRFTERFGLAKAVSGDVVADALAAIGADLARLDGRPRPGSVVRWRRRDEPSRGEARPGHLRSGRRPGHAPRPGRDQSTDRALEPWTRPDGGRSPGCSRRVPRSSCWRVSSGPSSTSSTARRSPSAIAACATACSSSAWVGQDVKRVEQPPDVLGIRTETNWTNVRARILRARECQRIKQ